jgi:hypothetical protein
MANSVPPPRGECARDPAAAVVHHQFARAWFDIARERERSTLPGERIAADKRLLEEMKDPLMHMIGMQSIRN